MSLVAFPKGAGALVDGRQAQTQPVPQPPRSSDNLNVALFCGGRGSASLIRELMTWPHVNLSLLLNAYDDGLSTGELRAFIPDMLGPSDFRKNLSRVLDLHSSEQYALRRVLEYRLPKDFSRTEAENLLQFIKDPSTAGNLIAPLRELFAELDDRLRQRIIACLAQFFDFYRATHKSLNLADCSLGNLVFAGSYLECDRNFNAAIGHLAGFAGVQAYLINVNRGENRTLVALKEDGQILNREAEIVGPQSASPIADIFLLEQPLTAEQLGQMEGLPLAEKRRCLKALEMAVELSPAAAKSLLDADIIIYGPGSQFSSLMPSYRTAGLPEVLRQSRASVKIFVANLDVDHDIQSLSTLDLVDKALMMLNDPENRGGLITDILYNRGSAGRGEGVKLTLAGRAPRTHKSARVIEGDFENPVESRVHSGYSVVRQAFALHKARCTGGQLDTLDIYIDLLDRSCATESLLQEFLELPWQQKFAKVRLAVNRLGRVYVRASERMDIEPVESGRLFSEVDVLTNWLVNGASEYLATITGDGEYRLRDIVYAMETFESGVFGAVYGSRTQSRRQFRSALRAAYGEMGFLYWLSWLGAFVFAVVFGLRFRVIFSDPLTGFRIYQRSKLNPTFRAQLLRGRLTSAATVTRLLIRNGIEIAEVPVTYRTFSGFTKPLWRLTRGMRNLWGAFS